MNEDCGTSLINQGTLYRTAEATIAEKNEEPDVVTSSSSPYDENTDDEDFTSSSRRDDMACSMRGMVRARHRRKLIGKIIGMNALLMDARVFGICV